MTGRQKSHCWLNSSVDILGILLTLCTFTYLILTRALWGGYYHDPHLKPEEFMRLNLYLLSCPWPPRILWFFFPFLVLKDRGQISVTKHKGKDILINSIYGKMPFLCVSLCKKCHLESRCACQYLFFFFSFWEKAYRVWWGEGLQLAGALAYVVTKKRGNVLVGRATGELSRCAVVLVSVLIG